MPQDGYIRDEEPKKEKVQPMIGKVNLKGDILLIKMPEMEIEKGGIVVDEEKALNSRCHGFKIPLNGEITEMVWSPGIVGCLNDEEKVEYCKLGIDWKEPPAKLKERLRILHEAGIFRK